MFTGIVQSIGRVTARDRSQLVVEPRPPFRSIRPGESISVDGVCLTVDHAVPGTAQRITFRLLPETVRVSTLGVLRPGQSVHLERAVRAGDRLGGHLLLGHVDGQGRVLRRSGGASAVTLEIRAAGALVSCLVPKGPIAVDGVSLTLDSQIGRDRFRVHLVSRTLRQTHLGLKKTGDPVNLETDWVVKYLRGML